MIVIPQLHVEPPHRRTHPWTVTEYDSSISRYHDFKESPELIETGLEDFQAHSRERGVKEFYALLRWLNRPEGKFESNDCAFRPPEVHGDTIFRKPLKISGRLQFFYRDLDFNVPLDSVLWLLRMFHLYLSLEHREVEYTVFETSVCPTDYVAINQLGSRIEVQFGVYGDSSEDTFAAYEVAVAALHTTLERIEIALQASVPQFP